MSIRDKAIAAYDNPQITELESLLLHKSDMLDKRVASAIKAIYVDNWNDTPVSHEAAPFSIVHLTQPPLRTPRGIVIVNKTQWTVLKDKWCSFKASIRLYLAARRARKAFLKAS